MRATPEALKVLVLEDHVDAAEVLRLTIARWGHDVVVAHDGRTAITLAEDYRPDVILLDIVVPHVHGYDVAREIRSRPWAGNTRLFAVTAWGQEPDRRMSAQAGIEHHFLKPVDTERLRQALTLARPTVAP